MDDYPQSQFKLLRYRHVYGTNLAVSNNLLFTPSPTNPRIPLLTYLAGQCVVFKDLTGTQPDRIEPIGTSSTHPTCLSYFHQERLLAVGFRSPRSTITSSLAPASQPYINLYDVTSRPLRRRIQLGMGVGGGIGALPSLNVGVGVGSHGLSDDSGVGSDRFVWIDKGSDGKFLVAQGGAPDWILVIWRFDGIKCKVLTRIETGTATSGSGSGSSSRPNELLERGGIVSGGSFSDGGGGGGDHGIDQDMNVVRHVSFAPDGRQICVTGNGVFRILRIDEEDGTVATLKFHLRMASSSSSASAASGSGSRSSLAQTDSLGTVGGSGSLISVSGASAIAAGAGAGAGPGGILRENFTCHCWLDNDRLIVMNDVASIFLVSKIHNVVKLRHSPDDHIQMHSMTRFVVKKKGSASPLLEILQAASGEDRGSEADGIDGPPTRGSRGGTRSQSQFRSGSGGAGEGGGFGEFGTAGVDPTTIGFVCGGEDGIVQIFEPTVVFDAPGDVVLRPPEDKAEKERRRRGERESRRRRRRGGRNLQPQVELDPAKLPKLLFKRTGQLQILPPKGEFRGTQPSVEEGEIRSPSMPGVPESPQLITMADQHQKEALQRGQSIEQMSFDSGTGQLIVGTRFGHIHRVKLRRGFSEDDDDDVVAEDEIPESEESEGEGATVGVPAKDSVAPKLTDEEEEVDDVLRDHEFECIMAYHSKAVTGVDTCTKKPFAVSASLDKSIRLLDYLTGSSVSCRFRSECLSVSLHPSGFYLLAGFADSLKFIKILGDRMSVHMSFPVRNCLEVKFCRGGHLFAAVYGTVINVYSTYSLKLLHALRGHNGRVKSLVWKDEDSNIVSVDMNGAVAEFKVSSEKKINDNSAAKTSFASVVASEDVVYAAASDANVHVFRGSVPQTNCPTGSYAPTALALAERSQQLFVGLEDGSICVFDTSQESFEDYEDRFFVHASSVTKLVLTHRENLLLSAGADGTMCIFEVVKPTRKSAHIAVKTDQFSAEILISRMDLQEKNSIIQQLQERYEDLKAENDYDSQKKEIEFREKFRLQQERFQLDLRQKDERIRQLENDLKTKNQSFIEDLEREEGRFRSEIDGLTKHYNQQIKATMSQLQGMQEGKDNEIQKLLDVGVSRKLEHENRMRGLSDSHVDDMKRLREEIDKLKADLSYEDRQYEEMKRQTIKDHEELKLKISEMYEVQLKKKVSDNLKLSGENTIKENNERDHEKTIKTLKNQFSELQALAAKKDQALENMKNTTEFLMAQNTDRENTIVEKEKRIFELKKANQELEKHKFVLDYEIQRLTDLIKPTKQRIVDMRKDMRRKGVQMERCKATNLQHTSREEALTRKIARQRGAIKAYRNRIREAEVYQSRVQSEIHELVQHVQNPLRLREMVRLFHRKHVNTTVDQLAGLDEQVQEETHRQVCHLEMTIDQLKKKLSKTNRDAQEENMRIMHENVRLINEINKLRKEARLQKSRLREKEDRTKLRRRRRGALLAGQEEVEGEGEAGEDMRPTSSTSTDIRIRHNESEKRRKRLSQILEAIAQGKAEIQALRAAIERMEQERRSRSRPTSREQLPPLQ